MKNLLQVIGLILLSVSITVFSSCDKDEDPEVISGFSYSIDPADYRKVIFTNAAQNFSQLEWDFGDNSPISTEENPVHVYPGAGSYTVKLTATNSKGEEDVLSQTLTIIDTDAELTKLVGDVSKTWKLLRAVGPGRWPLEVGPIDRSTVWWAQGRDNDEIALRPCIMNDEYTFRRDKSYIYDSNGDFWAEGGVFEPANLCQETTTANLTGPNGTNLSAFGDGTHTFTIEGGKLTVSGLGAFIALPKIGTDTEVSTPQQSVTLDVVKLSEGTVDTLILESKWKFGNNTSGQDDAYWRITLVHYDNAADEPAIPSPKPIVGFSYEADGLSVSFTNSSRYATSYSWDFGDGSTSTQESPSHTYASAGIYTVILTATNSVGSSSTQQELTVTSGAMTEANLIGGAWRVRNAANSVYVGPGLGDNSWWGVPANFLDGSSTGGDDWSCMTNDEFIFSAGGTYQYKTNGDARNDGYMGSPNGCWSDAQIAGSGNGAAFGSGTHTFAFTPASSSPSGRPIITVNNGASGAAFVGFYKGYYGGENSNGTNAPNGGASSNRYEVMSYLNDGTTETLTISVDISAGHDGSAAWTMVLVR